MSIFWARARVSRWSSGPAEPVERQERRAPLPSPVQRFVQMRAAVHAGRAQSAGRGWSQNRNAGQRFSKCPIAARGVSPSVKNP